jgi:cytochrome c
VKALYGSAAAAVLAAALLGLVPPRGAAETPTGGDPVRGKAIYSRCMACHALDRDRVGPRHCGLFGRRAGTVPGFHYSDAMRRSGIVWSAKTLDHFLENPPKVVPGTTMTYAGIKDARERRDLIAYLMQANASKTLCP